MTVDDPGADAALADWALRDRAAGLRLFVVEARTQSASARLALGYTLRESVWMGSDATINDAKSGWWIEELALSDGCAARHPLTRMLTQQETRVDFSALARALSGLRTTTPDNDPSRTLALLRDLETTLWFGPGPADPDACTIRARAALVDVLDRRAVASDDVEKLRGAIAAQRPALRDASAVDAWTAARRAQALCWIGSMGRPAATGRIRRWREVWTVWRAVRSARRGATSSATAGERSGT